MQIVKQVFSKIYILWVLVVFTLFMIILLPVFVLPILIGQKHGNITYFGLALWAWIFSKLTFIRYEVIGKKNIDTSQSYIYTSNHTSFLDAPGLVLGVPTQFRPLAKKELLKIPVFGLIVRVATIVVDRSSAQSRKDSVKLLVRRLQEGLSILIFPEGTQNRSKEPLQPFYDGAFRIATETQTPILPIVIVNAGKLMPPTGFSIKPGKVKVVLGDPIPVDKYAGRDIKELKQLVFDRMTLMLENNKVT